MNLYLIRPKRPAPPVYFLRRRRREDVFMIICLTLFVFAQSFAAKAIPSMERPVPEDVGAGTLWFPGENGQWRQGTLVKAEAEIEIAGLWSDTRLTQHFSNPTDQWQEATYVFPLPSTAAVHSLRIVSRERIIEGEILPTRQARTTYEKARDSGRQAALTEQHRPNLFRTSVANIPPQATVQIEIRFNQTLDYQDGQFHYRLPMTMTPRYFPGAPQPERAQNAPVTPGWAMATDEVPDAGHISPFTVSATDLPEGDHHLSLTVHLAPGMEINAPQSISHRIETKQITQGTAPTYEIHLGGRQAKMDRDFLLAWSPRAGTTPRAALFTASDARHTYGTLLFIPPSPPMLDTGRKTLILVVDTSGSMGGQSIRQAREALHHALDQLQPEDSFNLIQFNSAAEALFREERPATPEALVRARRYINTLTARGGTEIKSALDLALSRMKDGVEEDAATAPDPVRQVVFITDGSVGNEESLFTLIRQRLGNQRLFTVGIGTAPNHFFMKKAAEFGRGSYVHIPSPRAVASRMKQLFDKIRYPVLRDISIRTANTSQPPVLEAYPEKIRDLYAHDPIHFSFRLPATQTTLALHGITAEGRSWQQAIVLDHSPSSAPGIIPRLWARAKLDHLMNDWNRKDQREKIRAEAEALALEYHLISRFTSLVAVDKTPMRNTATQALDATSVPTLLPAGATSQMLRYPQTATPATLLRHVGMALGLIGLLTAYGIRRKPRFSGSAIG